MTTPGGYAETLSEPLNEPEEISMSEDPYLTRILFETKDSGAKDTFASGYQRDCSVGKGAHDLLPFFALTRDAQLYERGAAKYGRDNWMKGAPFSRTMQSAIRHLFQYMMGDRSEDHLAASRWGIAAIMTYEEMIARGQLPKELDDLPRYDK
jgi:hypothetical protein